MGLWNRGLMSFLDITIIEKSDEVDSGMDPIHPKARDYRGKHSWQLGLFPTWNRLAQLLVHLNAKVREVKYFRTHTETWPSSACPFLFSSYPLRPVATVPHIHGLDLIPEIPCCEQRKYDRWFTKKKAMEISRKCGGFSG